MPLSGRGGARATPRPQVKYTAAAVRSSDGLFDISTVERGLFEDAIVRTLDDDERHGAPVCRKGATRSTTGTARRLHLVIPGPTVWHVAISPRSHWVPL